MVISWACNVFCALVLCRKLAPFSPARGYVAECCCSVHSRGVLFFSRSDSEE